MLTETERDWLLRQRDALLEAAGRSYLYEDALQATRDGYERGRSWKRPFRALRLRADARRLERLRDDWSALTRRRATVLSTWLGIQKILTGADRGPIARAGKNRGGVVRELDRPFDGPPVGEATTVADRAWGA